MTNPVLSAIADRRSIRAYTDAPVTKAQIDILLTAALEAPSARNMQPWHITVVQDAALLRRINDAYRAEFAKVCPDEMRDRLMDPAHNVFHGAGTVLFFSCPALSEMPYAQTDVGIAIQTVALAAHAIDLGSVILGMPRFAFQGAQGDALASALSFPAGYDFCLAIALGTASATKDPHPQADNLYTIL